MGGAASYKLMFIVCLHIVTVDMYVRGYVVTRPPSPRLQQPGAERDLTSATLPRVYRLQYTVSKHQVYKFSFCNYILLNRHWFAARVNFLVTLTAPVPAISHGEGKEVGTSFAFLWSTQARGF